MKHIVSATTDVGIRKTVNQDSLVVKVFETPIGEVVFAVLCDGMGGLSKGELASAAVVHACSEWIANRCDTLFSEKINWKTLYQEWNDLIQQQNEQIRNYGIKCGIKLGTTLTAILLAAGKYYIAHIGDSRAYEIKNSVKQLTRDHTVTAEEVRNGKITKEQEKTDSRQHILLQCIGVSQNITPEIYYGKCKKNAVYMLCSDGFRHKITESEILEIFHPNKMKLQKSMQEREQYLIDLNKKRGEQDNISVITIKTY